MNEEEQDANATESSTVEPEVLDANAEDSSASEQDVVEESSPQEVEQKETPFHEHPRWKEVQAEKKYYQDLVQQLASRQDSGESQKQVEADPYASMSAEEAHFYRNLDTRTQKMIQQKAEELARPMQQQQEQLAKQMSQILTEQFRTKNTDVPANSEEEVQIAELIRSGVPLEKATWAVMGPKRVEAAQRGKIVKKQQQVKQKAQANLETSGVPENSGIPKDSKMSFREKFVAELDKVLPPKETIDY